MTNFSSKTVATALAAVILSTSIVSTVSVTSAEAGMRGHGIERMHRGHGGYRGHRGHGNRNMAIGLGIAGAIAIIGSAIEASRNAVPAHVKRRCEQANEWDQLARDARSMAAEDRRRGDKAGANFMMREALRRERNAQLARIDCKRWMAEYR